MLNSSFLGNVIALLAVAWKTGHELWWNERRFRLDIQGKEGDLGTLSTARQHKQERARFSTIVVFGALAVSYGLFILGGIYGW